MKRIVILATMVALLLPMTSCFIRINNDSIRSLNANHLAANGVMVSEDRSLDAFESLVLQGGLDVRFVQAAGEPHMNVTISENILPYLKTEVQDSMLTVRFHSDSLSSFSFGEHSITVYAPALSSVTILGSGDFTCDGLSSDRDFSVALRGSGDVTLKEMQCDGLDITITGSGDIRADAQIKGAVAVAIAGSGDVKLSGSAESADYSIAGSGDIDARNLAVSGNVSQQVHGSGDILIH